LHVMDRGANGHGAVAHDGQLDTGRHRALHLRNFLAYLANDLDDICTGLTLDLDDDGGRALIPTASAVVFQPIDDLRDVADGDRGSVAISDNDRPILIRRRNLVVR